MLTREQLLKLANPLDEELSRQHLANNERNRKMGRQDWGLLPKYFKKHYLSFRGCQQITIS